MAKDVMIEITKSIPPGTELKTPSGRSRFVFYHIDPDRILLQVGAKQTILTIPASCVENLSDFLRGKGWIKIGALHSESDEETLDTFIKHYTHGTSAASYVAPILEKSKIIEISRGRPAKVKLLQ